MDPLEQHLHHQIEHLRGYFWHRVRWAAVRTQLASTESFTVLDVGAGSGLLGDYLQRDFPRARYRFIEPLDSLAQLLEARFGADANAIADRDHADADYVCLLDVLEHQPDDDAFLAELTAGMRPGAILIVTVPALASLWSRWDELLGHHRRYSRADLAAVAAGQPLEVLETSYLFPEMWPVAAIRRRRMRSGVEADARAEFPVLPKPVNGLLYAIGRTTLRTRRINPIGTSVLLVARRR